MRTVLITTVLAEPVYFTEYYPLTSQPEVSSYYLRDSLLFFSFPSFFFSFPFFFTPNTRVSHSYLFPILFLVVHYNLPILIIIGLRCQVPRLLFPATLPRPASVTVLTCSIGPHASRSKFPLLDRGASAQRKLTRKKRRS